MFVKIKEKDKDKEEKQEELTLAQRLRKKFWKEFIPQFNNKSTLYANITCEERTDHWLSSATGMGSGISYNFLIGRDFCGVELAVATSETALNKKVYDFLYSQKGDIDQAFAECGICLEWHRLDGSKASKISARNRELSLFDESQWEKIKEYLTENMLAFSTIFFNYVKEVKSLIKNKKN